MCRLAVYFQMRTVCRTFHSGQELQEKHVRLIVVLTSVATHDGVVDMKWELTGNYDDSGRIIDVRAAWA